MTPESLPAYLQPPEDDELIRQLQLTYDSVGPPYNSTSVERWVKHAANEAEEALLGTWNAISVMPEATDEAVAALVEANLTVHRRRLWAICTDFCQEFEKTNADWTESDAAQQDVTNRIAEQFLRANGRLARILFMFPCDEQDGDRAFNIVQTNIRLAAHFHVLDQLSANENNRTIIERRDATFLPSEEGLKKLEPLIRKQEELRDQQDEQRRKSSHEYVPSTFLLIDHLNNIGTLHTDSALMLDDASVAYMLHVEEARRQFIRILNDELQPPLDVSTEQASQKFVRASSNLAYIYILLAEQHMQAGGDIREAVDNVRLFAETFETTLERIRAYPALRGEVHSELIRHTEDAALVVARLIHDHPELSGNDVIQRACRQIAKHRNLSVPEDDLTTVTSLIAPVRQFIGKAETEQTDPEDEFFLRRTKKRLADLENLLADTLV